MKVSSLFHLLGLGQCGFFGSLEDILDGSIIDLVGEGRTELNSAAKLMLSLADKSNGILGEIPMGAVEAWNTVIAEVPNGAEQLKNAILSEVTKRTPRPKKPSRKITSDFDFTITDSKFPGYQVRLKDPSSLGIDKVKQYSGYLDVEDADKHFFFWFFESRGDPKNDPVVLWLNGGPGCSSLTGLFFELGPASIGEDLQPIHNKYSWNENANVIFLDQPVGVGYSYGDDGVGDTAAAGKDAYAFLELFFKQFPEYSDNDFHISGESYAGHYIPVFGSEILSHDDRHFNLTSVLIGNGITDPLRQYNGYQPMACGKGGMEPVLAPETCEDMLNTQVRCNTLIDRCYKSPNAWNCVPATIYCESKQELPVYNSGHNVYDLRDANCGDKSGNCYPQLDIIDEYLNQEEVKLAVGASGVEEYKGCRTDINLNFMFHGDMMLPYYTSVQDLLAREIPVLLYAGDKDFICNWVGNEIWSRELEWAGHEEFAATEFSNWKLKNGKKAGKVRNYKHFTFLRVFDAGHMVPFNQPEASLEMLNRWIQGDFTYA